MRRIGRALLAAAAVVAVACAAPAGAHAAPLHRCGAPARQPTGPSVPERPTPLPPAGQSCQAAQPSVLAPLATPAERTSSVLGTLGSIVSAPVRWGTGVAAGAVLGTIGSWVLDGTEGALRQTAQIIGQATSPRLTSTWFSATYWRVVGLATLLTLPFLFAAAVQSLMRGDLALLLRSAFGYLPLAMLAVVLAGPVTMLLLSATDEMCAEVSSTGVGGGAHFLDQAAIAAAGVSALSGSPFLAVAVGMLTIGAALALALELLIRAAAVYVVVLMLPLAFAAFVWPARRVWAVRLTELLLALILSKFVIVAVLSLAGAAYGQSGGPGAPRLLVTMSLILLSTFAPWALLRILPFTELAAGAAGALRAEVPRVSAHAKSLMSAGTAADALPAVLMRQGRQDDPPAAAASSDAAFASPPGGWGATAAGAARDSDPRGATPPDTPVPESPPGPGPAPAPGRALAPALTGAAERSPGMDPIWQAEDGAWPPMVLGPGGWSGPTEWTPPAQTPEEPS